jgi:peptidoglycan/xylan/chitin deacetylase (PgdA/CDA1 family)
MIAAPPPSDKRELLARCLNRSGAVSFLASLPPRDSLLVFTYHRIGYAGSDPWDPHVISATAEEFDDQISFLKRACSVVTLEEALAFIDGEDRSKTPRCRVLVTFDDGYLDNYQLAYPILRSHGLQGLFFLCSNLVGSGFIPWWDHIAYLVKSGSRKQFSLDYPICLKVDIDADGLDESLRRINSLYKTFSSVDTGRFLAELKEAVGGHEPPAVNRRYLNWAEAREMLAGGMEFGAHTQNHPMLSKLSPEDQFTEISQSRSTIAQQLSARVETMAYPFGIRAAFTTETERLAEQAGYRAAFSYYGTETNRKGAIEPYNVKRVPVGSQSSIRLRVQTGIGRLTGSFWP